MLPAAGAAAPCPAIVGAEEDIAIQAAAPAQRDIGAGVHSAAGFEPATFGL